MVAVSLMLWKRRKITSRFLMFLAWASLAAFSLPIVSSKLFVWLEAPYVSQANQRNLSDVEAIVVLGGGRERNTPEYGGEDQVSYHSLWRLRYGARLAKEYQLPVIASGGTVYPYEELSEAAIATKVLEEEFGVAHVWQEGNSRDTWQNAQKTAALLNIKEIEKVILVTHAYHMRRAIYAFEQAKVQVVPMPTGFFSGDNNWLNDWLPTASALNKSRIAIHEYLGLAFYRARAFFAQK